MSADGKAAAAAPGAAAGSRQRCDACGAEYGERDARTRCARCGGLLALVHPPPALKGAALRALFDRRADAARRAAPDEPAAASGVWRFHELVLPSATADDVVSQPEGDTPLMARAAVSRWAGVEQLYLKHDGMNPTGSFKDRGMTVAITQARRAGASAAACASTGNTSASLAAYAALAGLPALVLVPAGQVALGKLAQTLAYGARTLLVRGDFDDCLRLTREAADRLGVYVANSVNPFRLEGQKTCVLEIIQQLAWEPPDWIVLPAGNLGNTSAFGAALRDALRAGLITKAPRLAAIQAAGAAPFAKSYRDGFAHHHRVRAETVATAIKIGDPASYDRAVRVIRETLGVVVDVPDEAILEAKAVVDAAGVGCEPASAASVAGVRWLVREKVIRPTDRVVAVLTGHILKDPGLLLDYHKAGTKRARANPPVEIDATLGAVEEALSAVAREKRA
ncbi:MAG TPA: threonine synthase [Gemmatimonadaceae bacterium]|nr:threonine synthase [Gemmatimonadaceae bacterium]